MLTEINKKYEHAMKIKDSFLRDKELSSLMTVMEKEFFIPILKNDSWEKENKKVIALYRKIARSRSFE